MALEGPPVVCGTSPAFFRSWTVPPVFTSEMPNRNSSSSGSRNPQLPKRGGSRSVCVMKTSDLYQPLGALALREYWLFFGAMTTFLPSSSGMSRTLYVPKAFLLPRTVSFHLSFSSSPPPCLLLPRTILGLRHPNHCWFWSDGKRFPCDRSQNVAWFGYFASGMKQALDVASHPKWKTFI